MSILAISQFGNPGEDSLNNLHDKKPPSSNAVSRLNNSNSKKKESMGGPVTSVDKLKKVTIQNDGIPKSS